jgi:ankyrin repeat protein
MVPTPNAHSVLALAVQNNDLYATELLLRYGADPNHTNDPYRITDAPALHHAPFVEMVDLLLRYGADIHGTDSVGNTALSYAVYKHRGLPLIRCLLQNGADPRILTTYNRLVDLVQDDEVHKLLAFYRRAPLALMRRRRRQN